MVVTEENWGTERHTCLNASWFGAGSTSTDLVSNSAPPHGDKATRAAES